MKIICTRQEKDLLLITFLDGSNCPFNSDNLNDYSYCKLDDCRGCIENNIEWQIEGYCENCIYGKECSLLPQKLTCDEVKRIMRDKYIF